MMNNPAEFRWKLKNPKHTNSQLTWTLKQSVNLDLKMYKNLGDICIDFKYF